MARFDLFLIMRSNLILKYFSNVNVLNSLKALISNPKIASITWLWDWYYVYLYIYIYICIYIIYIYIYIYIYISIYTYSFVFIIMCEWFMYGPGNGGWSGDKVVPRI